MTSYRLSSGGYIDRSKPLTFSFDGKEYQGFEGDSLASALLANNVGVIGRSFKYHRPRGFLAAGFDEPNAIIQLGSGARTVPNVKATQIDLFNGLEARSVNAWPNLKIDLLAINSLFKRFLPAGFYYKTFTWPNWHWFEPAIRRAAGLGVSPSDPDPDTYDKRFDEVDVLVVGGGIAGIVSAKIAADAGASVMLVEANDIWGGSAHVWPTQIEGLDASKWCDNQVSELASRANVRVVNQTLAFGYYDHNLIGLVQRMRTPSQPPESERSSRVRERFWKVRAQKVILATGALERPQMFPNNDRPGVMLCGAGARYVTQYGVAPGQKVLISTNNDSAYETARVLIDAGVNVIAIVDNRAQLSPEAEALSNSLGVRIALNTAVTNVKGGKHVSAAELRPLDHNGRPHRTKRETIDCDCLLTSAGWSPAVHLYSQSGGKLLFDEGSQTFVPHLAAQPAICVGSAGGVYQQSDLVKQTSIVVVQSLGDLGLMPEPLSLSTSENLGLGELEPVRNIDGEEIGIPSLKAWVDFQNDVTSSDVNLALRENYRSVEHVKRYTTLGMASDQGKTSNVNGISVMAQTLGRSPSKIGTTKFRPPYNPISIGAFAGRRIGENLMPIRKLPTHDIQIEHGAQMEEYGGWLRPAYYATDGCSEHDAVAREVLGTRASVGLFDASPLGKIEVFGTDAAEFLNRMYVNNMKSLKTGRCRYGLMLDENGIVFDDGILARISENHFLVGTTSGHAAAISDELQAWLQCEWVDLDVTTANVTTNWAVINLNGPKSRELLQTFNSDIDFGATAFPHMHYRQGHIEGLPCRVQRVSFSGELSYEVSVPWGYGAAFYAAVLEHQHSFQVQPFGIESLMAMRIEKGFLHVGSDTDGTTLPQDIGFGSIIEKKPDDFVGRRSTMRPDANRSDRRQLVGLEVTDGSQTPLTVGAHIVSPIAGAPDASQGWVSSSVFSPSLSKPVALGLVTNGRARIGEVVDAWDLGTRRSIRIVAPGAFDPKGDRLDA